MTTLVIATRNKGKIAEIDRILKFENSEPNNAQAIKVRSVAEFDIDDVDETGSTFEENALLKALTVARATGFPALADDSGLSVDALGGAPGIYSARYSGVHGDDGANIDKLLKELSNTSLDRSGRFVAVIALAKPDGSYIMARGELLGSIAESKRGENGFGYDPIFIPAGSKRTLGEYLPQEKDVISHRARALAEIAPKVGRFIKEG
ncbi:MAG: RdgB/HAM1 family non-canonical purine NTP pyrophosphatase [Candidatus Nanopelagicaceae bacterium]|nr:RdgB/HAM1 family non-canonical purine NTP pyrophosphatase [Candidatus Nanopelagicaceae bacterium]